MRLFKALGREIDLIIIDEKRYMEGRRLRGSIEHSASREGITV